MPVIIKETTKSTSLRNFKTTPGQTLKQGGRGSHREGREWLASDLSSGTRGQEGGAVPRAEGKRQGPVPSQTTT